jgi:hypothetical protein
MADIKTYGQLRQAIKDIILKQKLQKVGNVSVDNIIGAIPVLGNIKSGLDFVNAFVKAPDTQKTKTWLDKLQVDDEMSAIVDDTVENGFIKLMTASIEKEPDNKPLEPDFNMNAKMINYLKDTYKGRTIAGIQENKEANKLKEYIKKLVSEMLDEESSTAGVPGYLTPNAFAKKGQKTNAATKQAQRSGWKLAGGMPKNSKVYDYKELWKGKKSAMNNESNYDKASISSQSSGYTAASGYTAGGIKGDDYYKTNESMKESLLNIIEKEMINEVTYGKFKKDVKHRTKSEQLHKAIREVKKKLAEIDRIVEYTSRMKQELSEDGGINYWKATQKNVATISEMVNQLNNKIKNLNQ